MLPHVAKPRARDFGHPFHFGMAPGREFLEALAAAGDGQAPVVHGVTEGTDRCLKLRQPREPVCQIGGGRDGRQLRQFLGAGIGPAHTHLADQSGELREFPTSDWDGSGRRDQVIDVAEPGRLGGNPPGSFRPGRRFTGRPPSRKALDLRLTGRKQFLRRDGDVAAGRIQVGGELPDALVSERLVEGRDPGLDLLRSPTPARGGSRHPRRARRPSDP